MRVGEALRRRALARVQWYRLTPARLYFIDNQQGLGHRDEVEIGDWRLGIGDWGLEIGD